MKRLENKKIIRNDEYVLRVWDVETKTIISQGKRVRKGSPLDYEARRIYVKDGLILLVKHLKEKNGWSLGQTADFLRSIGIMEKKEWKYGSSDKEGKE